MSSHQSVIRGFLSIKPGVTLAEIKIACEPLLDLLGAAFEHVDIAYSEGTLSLDHIECWTDGVGAFNQNLVELADNLATLVSEPGWIELVDDDTGADDKIDVYFVAATELDRMSIQLKYGIERAREFLEPLVDRQFFEETTAHLYQSFMAKAGFLGPLGSCWYAVSGRIPGADEDVTHIFLVSSPEQAIEAFTAILYSTEPDPGTAKDNVFNTHGCFAYINSVLHSGTEIQVSLR